VELHPISLGSKMIDNGLLVLEIVMKKKKLLGGTTVENLVKLCTNLTYSLIQALARVSAELEAVVGILGQRMGRLDLNEVGRVVESNVHHTATFAVEIVVITLLIGESREDAFKSLSYVDAVPIGSGEDVVDLLDGARNNLVRNVDKMLEGVHLWYL
jgi:hypothetical protein